MKSPNLMTPQERDYWKNRLFVSLMRCKKLEPNEWAKHNGMENKLRTILEYENPQEDLRPKWKEFIAELPFPEDLDVIGHVNDPIDDPIDDRKDAQNIATHTMGNTSSWNLSSKVIADAQKRFGLLG